jgi:response regulator RpfG family c-di-GMP phosphodiesterase
MIASNQFVKQTRRREHAEALARVPQRAFGDTAWVNVALKNCALHLTPAIASGKPRRIANAVRAIAHAPTPQQIGDIIGAACDAALSEAHARHDTRQISNVSSARSVIGTVIADMRAGSERETVAPAALRELVDGYVQILGLLDKRLSERLDAVGQLAARIGAAMNEPPSVLFEIECAGRLHDVGTLSPPAATRATDTIGRQPVVGEMFLRSIPSLAHLAPIVRSHRERFDGTGGPDGLLGAEIPLASRIISVAAAFVDLMTESPLHAPVLPYDACHELALAAGTRFDPEVVAAVLQVLRVRQRTNRSA